MPIKNRRYAIGDKFSVFPALPAGRSFQFSKAVVKIQIAAASQAERENVKKRAVRIMKSEIQHEIETISKLNIQNLKFFFFEICFGFRISDFGFLLSLYEVFCCFFRRSKSTIIRLMTKYPPSIFGCGNAP